MSVEVLAYPAPPHRLWSWLGAVAVALLCLGVMTAHCLRLGAGPSALIGFGDALPEALHTDARIPDGFAIQMNTVGYDGQWIFIDALAPFDEASPVPPHRRQGLLLPGAAWLVALGHPVPTLWALITICLGSAFVAALVCGLWAREEKRLPLLPLLGAASAGVLLSCQHLTSEAALVASLAVGLFGVRRERWGMAWLGLACAALAHEVALAALLGVIIHLLLRRRIGRAVVMLLAIAPWLFWIQTIEWMTDIWVLDWKESLFTGDYASAWAASLLTPFAEGADLKHTIPSLLVALTPVLVVIIAVTSLRGEHRPLALAALLMCLYVVAGDEGVWGPFAAGARAVAPLTLAGALLANGSPRWIKWPLIALFAMTLALALLRAVALGDVPEITFTEVEAITPTLK